MEKDTPPFYARKISGAEMREPASLGKSGIIAEGTNDLATRSKCRVVSILQTK